MNKLTVSDIEPVQQLYDRGLYLQASKVAAQLQPLVEWRGGDARILAGRLARQLGAPRLSQGHHLLARREAPDLPVVRYYYGLTIIERRGPYAGWQLLKRFGDLEEASPKYRADWYALHALVAAELRDFDTAHTWLNRAEKIAPEHAWVSVIRAGVLLEEDREQEALEAAQQALSLRPWYRPAVETYAHILIKMSQDEEALAFLAEADNYIECASVVLNQIGLLKEHQRYQEANNRFQRLAELMPLMEKEVAEMFAGLQADVAYFLNDFQTAISLGRESGNKFLEQISANLEEPSRLAAQRVILPVAFVRQHYMTCVPATLTAISRFWSRPAEHLQIADQICYDGTTAYNERLWAEQNNWRAREFTVTENSLISLIDNGIPFTLSIIMPGNAHMQAVIGYDGRRGTMLVRDPYFRHTGEILIEKFLQEQAASGPRGMALVPIGERDKLEALELPDDQLWDQLNQFNGALERHRWKIAEQIYQNMVNDAPDHHLTLIARMRLAIYDENTVALLVAVEALLERYPGDEPLNLSRLSCLSELGRRDELLATYMEICAREDAHPIFTQRYAQALAEEAGQQKRATLLILKALRQWPAVGSGYYILANISWAQREYEQAFELYRFAICLQDKEEDFARAYFWASRNLQREEEALAFLHQRWQRFKKKSSLTARTLSWAYSQLERWPEALDVLEETLADHPEDGELMLEAAGLLAQVSGNNRQRANELLAAARGRAPLRQWLRTAANLMAAQEKPGPAVKMWQQLLEIQPLAMDAHQEVARLLAMVESQEAAQHHLETYAAQFPHYYPLQRLLVDWYRERQQNETYLLAAQKLVDLAPQNDLSLGYLGDALLLNEQPEEAMAVLREAFVLNPAYYFAGYNLFDLQLQQDQLDEAAGTLATLVEHSSGPLTMARSIQLGLRQEETERVKSELKKLCVTPDESGWALQAAINAMDEAGMRKEVFEILEEAIMWPEAIPEVGTFWMQGCFILNKQDCEKALPELMKAGKVGERATFTYLNNMVKNGQQFLLRQFIERNRHWLSESATLCSRVAYVLREIGENESALTWARDWRHFKEIQAWMLIVPVELFWTAGRLDEVNEICRHAIQLPPDYTTSVHRIWLAAERVLSGDAEHAKELLNLVDSFQLYPLDNLLYVVTEAMVRLSTAEATDRRPVFQEIRSQLQWAAREVKQLPQNKSASRRLYHQTLQHIGREAGGFNARIWCYWLRFRSR